jgi:hypothetical protein
MTHDKHKNANLPKETRKPNVSNRLTPCLRMVYVLVFAPVYVDPSERP